MAAFFQLYPLNDFAKYVKGKEISSTTGAVTPEIAGTVTAFFSTTNLPTSVAADPTLSMSATFVTAVNKWLVFFDRSVLTASLLASKFGAAPTEVYLIVDDGVGWRVYAKGEYIVSRPMTLG